MAAVATAQQNPAPQLPDQALHGGNPLRGIACILDGTHDGRAHDHAVGKPGRGARLVARVDSEPHDDGQAELGAHGGRARARLRCVNGRAARHPGHRHVVDEGHPTGGCRALDRLDALAAAGRRQQRHHADPRRARGLSQRRALLDRQVNDEQRIDPGLGRLTRNPRLAVDE